MIIFAITISVFFLLLQAFTIYLYWELRKAKFLINKSLNHVIAVDATCRVHGITVSEEAYKRNTKFI